MVVYGLAWKFGKEMQIETVGELARTLAAEHYFRLRRDPVTINRKEFREILITKLNQNYPRESDRVTADSRL